MISQFAKIRTSKLWALFAGDRGSNLWIFAFVILLSSIAALLEGVSFTFLLTAFSGIEGAAQTHQSYLHKWFFSQIQGTRLFFYCMISAIVFQILRSAISYASTVFSTKFAFKLQTKIQSEIYRQILRLSYACITRIKVGDLLEHARAPAYFIHPMLEGASRLMVSLLTSLVIVSMMFYLEPGLTIISAFLFGFFAFIQKKIIKKILDASRRLSNSSMEANQDTSQMLQGIKIIHAFSQQKRIGDKIQEKVREISLACKKIYLLSNIVPYLNEMISVFVLGLILTAAAIFIGLENESFLSVLMTFLLLSYRLSTRVQNALGVLATTSIYYGHLLRTKEILEDSDKEFLPEAGILLDGHIETISLENIAFRYATATADVLNNISFSIPKGATIGIVGLSGSGKTSLIDLLLRLYEPTQGRICVNTLPIQNISLASWRSRFAIVGQDPFLFDESIEENIRFGLDQISMEQVRQVAKTVGIDEMIQHLPDGYQTVVGERGLRLSGGEKQRLTLARALLRNPEILILDEATSNLDSQSELHIQSALEKVQKTKTIIMIAHRISTIIHSDVILVIEKGVLIESGTHEELLNLRGRYYNLWELQTSKQQEKVEV